MKYFARHLFIVPTCLIAASSWPQQPLKHDVAGATAAVAHFAEPAPRVPMSSSRYVASSIDSFTHADGWLAGLLGAGLIALQLHRRQRTLQAPRLTT